ncbi:rCG55488, isoform CRA_a [Rattus norvegicus]|uniref:RCG55488, isoform CRA_a n=1 Tax=Rattus norvegicus TaxID=10116 RepID=A6JR93_RAT|nr:rCG55488, isoform CRA_a [Rattus norvegicus]
MALTSNLERRRVMPLRSDASGTLQAGWLARIISQAVK